jgi:TonB-linked SusC/RagA family outer membrane protein
MRKIFTLLSLLILAGNLAFAQTVQISGTITSSEDKMPIAGASVFVKGTTIGALTDVNGKFAFSAPTKVETLIVSFIGFRTQEISLGGRTNIDVSLEQDLFKVDEVVVVAYGTQQKRDITGSVSSVKGADIRAVPVQSFDQALAGKAAGVSITMPNGVLNNPPVIRVRGFNSITSSSNPLVVVDGVPIFTGNIGGTAIQNSLADINPNDIESMEILKDASATALYGSRAANGVIIITTKRGSGARTKVTYDGYAGFTEPFRLFDMMNADQYLEHKNRAIANVNGTPLVRANDVNGNPIATNWADYIYRKGFQQNHALTISGSSPSTSYYLSVGYSDQDGMIKNNFYTRKNARMNVDHKVNKYITLGANFAYTNGYTESPNTGSNFSTAGAARLAFVLPPILAPYNNDGTFNIVNGAMGSMGTGLPTSGLGYYNPAQIFATDKHTTTSDRIIATLTGSFEPVKNLVIKTVYGMDNLTRETTTYWSPIGGDGYSYKGYAYNWTGRDNRWTWTNTINYNLTLVEKLNIGLLAGTEQQKTSGRSWNADKQLVSDPFFTSFAGSWAANTAIPGGSFGENFYSSVFGRASLNWNKKYYLEGSYRRDGYSGLSKDNKYGNFGGVSLMWNLSNEEFMKGLGEIFSDMRLKASYGRVGNMFGIGNYSSLFLYGGGLYGGSSSFAFSQAGNPDLFNRANSRYETK